MAYDARLMLRRDEWRGRDLSSQIPRFSLSLPIFRFVTALTMFRALSSLSVPASFKYSAEDIGEPLISQTGESNSRRVLSSPPGGSISPHYLRATVKSDIIDERAQDVRRLTAICLFPPFYRDSPPLRRFKRSLVDLARVPFSPYLTFSICCTCIQG